MIPTVSVVIPCLNEEIAIEKSIKGILAGLKKLPKSVKPGRILVVDNGSTDISIAIAKKYPVIIIQEKKRGYGRALLSGIKKAPGEYIVMGDCDGTYDFRQMPSLIRKLQSGADLVLGSRFGGTIHSNAMPFFNRFIGNPLLTLMINVFYGCKITDSQTGFRAFSRTSFNTMNLVSPGMEFASEMIIKTIAHRLNISEVPISYHPRLGQSKLSPISDAWRHIQSILIYSPTYAIIIPGCLSAFVGFFGSIFLLTRSIRIGHAILGIHTMILFVLLSVFGVQIILTGLISRLYTVKILNIQGGVLTKIILKYITLERLFVLGMLLQVAAFIIIALITNSWVTSGFSALAWEKEFVSAAGLAMIGGQMVFSSLLFGILREK